MTASGLRGDALELMTRGGTRARTYTASLIVAITTVTGILYALPLGEHVDNHVSNSSFTVLSTTVLLVAVVRARRSAGAHRVAWILLAGSFTITTILFILDPQNPDGDLTIALDFAVFASIGFWVSVLALGLPALPGLASLRAAADALWATTALLVAVWPWTIHPLLHIDGPSPLEKALYVSFAISTIALSTTVVVITPHTAGRGRVALWGLGAGGAIVSTAGVFHIRFFYEGTLKYGTGWDYLWTLGLALLALAGLLTVENELRPRRRGVRYHALMTLIPLGLAGTAILVTEPGPGHLVGAVVLLAVLSLRVIALLAENQRLTDSLSVEANNDPLTGLGNRRALKTGVEQIGRQAVVANRFLAVAIIDLDRFKEVNDTHGHLVGDEVLRIVARRLRDAVRDRDLLVRHGGDEFVAAMIVRSESEARRAADRLGDAVRGDYSLPVGSLWIGATIGLAVDHGTARLDDIMAVADAALYRAKGMGRGSVHIEMCSISR